MFADSIQKSFDCGAVPCVVVLSLLVLSASASAQIRRPGAHIKYGVEIEPHLVLQWDDGPLCGDDGIGAGVRASIPIIDNGPIPSINNNMAISFGLDFAVFDGHGCGAYWRRVNLSVYDDAEGLDIWLPGVLQWNFFITDIFSAFGEMGFAIQHSRWDLCNDSNLNCDDTKTDAELVAWIGGRVYISPTVSFTFRIGHPSLLLGFSFFL